MIIALFLVVRVEAQELNYQHHQNPPLPLIPPTQGSPHSQSEISSIRAKAEASAKKGNLKKARQLYFEAEDIAEHLRDSNSILVSLQKARLHLEKANHSNLFGFHKDIFMDGGVNLSSRQFLPAADSLKLTYEFYAGESQEDQNRLIGGYQDDLNGTLLYPDGSPRFRMIYVNGGRATKHGLSLGKPILNRYREHNRRGGSFCGTCAGAFFAGLSIDDDPDPREGYLHIYPYTTFNTHLFNARVDHSIPKNSPLLNYRKFGGDYHVPDVFHNGGNWILPEKIDGFKGTEVLAYYDLPDHEVDKGVAIWSIGHGKKQGRVVSVGSHPEIDVDGETRELLEACFLYALDGIGETKTKGTLVSGQTRKMDQSTADNNPDYTVIGDGQVHYFKIVIPKGKTKLRFEINQPDTQNYQFNYYLSRSKSLIAQSQAEYSDQQPGNRKIFPTTRMKPGKWILAVECATRVKTVNQGGSVSSWFEVTENKSLLNGAAYAVTIHIE